MQADGYIPPWKKMFGDAWTPEPASAFGKPSFTEKASQRAAKTASWPDVVGHELAELPGEEYAAVSGKGIFHTLPPRHNGIDPEMSLGNRPPFKANPNDARAGAFSPGALPEGEEVAGELPEEPVHTGWSSLSYIQPAGYTSAELTLYSRGAYGAF